ncbi:hypothetical protein NG796_19760 [Laspinema sp. A4]|nr:hypothetical protein [Laspinema sp. D2d]
MGSHLKNTIAVARSGWVHRVRVESRADSMKKRFQKLDWDEFSWEL